MKTALFVLVLLIMHSRIANAEYPTALDLKEDEAEKICAGYKNYSPGPDAVPTDEDRRLFMNEKVCGGFIEESIGNLKELNEFRRCCLIIGNCNRELAMIFANAWGAGRDYDAALYFLCRAADEMAAAEQWAMIGHIQEMRKDKNPQDLLYCDYASSGAGQLYCGLIEKDLKDTGRENKIEKLRKTLDQKSQEKLGDLVKATEKFAGEEGALAAVPDIGGTGYPAEVLSEQGKIYDDAVSAIIRFAGKRASEASVERLKKADADLNNAYKSAMANPPECVICSDPKTEGVNALRDAQRAWIKWREAWILFYQTRWRAAAAADVLKREITTELTVERTKKLRKIRKDALFMRNAKGPENITPISGQNNIAELM